MAILGCSAGVADPTAVSLYLEDLDMLHRFVVPTSLVAVIVMALAAADATGQEGSPVSLSVKIKGARLFKADNPGAPGGRFHIETTLTNNGSEMLPVTKQDLRFLLFNSRNQPLFILTDQQQAGPDMRPVEPGESTTMRVNCLVTHTQIDLDKPYRLVVIGYGGAARKKFEFKAK